MSHKLRSCKQIALFGRGRGRRVEERVDFFDFFLSTDLLCFADFLIFWQLVISPDGLHRLPWLKDSKRAKSLRQSLNRKWKCFTVHGLLIETFSFFVFVFLFFVFFLDKISLSLFRCFVLENVTCCL